MDQATIRKIAKQLFEAEQNLTTIPPLTETYPDITDEDAYKIQLDVVQMKLGAGQVVVGKKIGLTNFAMQARRGINEPDYGHVFDVLMGNQEVPISLSTLIQPKMEAEIAFVLKEDLKGPGVTAAQVLAATAGVMASFEVVDSRIADWKIELADTVADNASCGRVILGGKLVPVENLDLRTVGLVLERNGEIVDTAAGAVVLGGPAESVAWLANKLGSMGVALKAGEFIMSGSFTITYAIEAGDVYHAHFGGVGSVKARFIA
ncbi:MAG: 2-keto-4-pentenoate hydratase [Ruminococcaceae bacterium]|nr:2-keto-4-pentenoate hydratase [Oscillospiraceae bacterium]